MTIKITGLELRKDTTKIKSTPTEETRTLIGLEGELELEVSHGQFKGQDFYNLSKVSEELKNKLYDVLIDIEKELENKEPIKIKMSSTYGSGGTIGNTANSAKLHTSEKVLNKSEVDKILNQAYDLSKGVLVGSDIFAESQKSAEDFAKGIAEILDLYSEFAKLGNKKVDKKEDDSLGNLF